jgi:hypothetical protein
MAKKADLTGERFGIEIETAGQSRTKVAQAVVEATNGRITARNQGPYQATIVRDEKGRDWKILNDASIDHLNGHSGNEIVSPVLTYPDDIEMLKTVIRNVREAGATASKNCGIHIHVDGQSHTTQSLNNLAKMFYKNEDLIFQALNVSAERRSRWARPMDEAFIDKVVKRRPRTKSELNEAWFGGYNGNPGHYDSHRYRALNFNNLWRDIQTIEVRVFNGSLNCLKVIPYVQLCLAMSVKARSSKSASHKKIATDNPKFNFRVWLVAGLGMVGEEYKTARETLIKNLPGNSAWR